MNRSLSVALKYGLIITGGLIAYFVILSAFNLHTNIWLRIANGFFMAAGIYFAIKNYKHKYNTTFTYADGFKTGLLTGFIATGFFTLFMAIYMFHLDKEFAHNIVKHFFNSGDQGGALLILIIIMEGLSSTAILTLTFMQIFKKSNPVDHQEHSIDHQPKAKL